MKKCLPLLLAAAFVFSLPAYAVTPDVPASQRLQSIVKQIRQVRETEIELQQAKESLSRIKWWAGGTALVSGTILYQLWQAYRYKGEAPSKFMQFMMAKNTQRAGYPVAGILFGGSTLAGGYEVVHLMNEISNAQAVLAQERLELQELYQSAEIR